MKYMGSKRQMLGNGLGELLQKYVPKSTRVVDPFCGAGSVIQYVACNFNKEVIAGDLQEYAIVLANAVLGRVDEIDTAFLEKKWLAKARAKLHASDTFVLATKINEKYSNDLPRWVKESRKICDGAKSNIGPIWKAYGGHYFSPLQALSFDYLIRTLPEGKDRNVCLAAIITAASRCAASPGHTAQPFQPTSTAQKFIKISWSIDPFKSCEAALKELAPVHAKVKGKAVVSDAAKLASKLREGDLVIIDPPYSEVQYSRFYHVLETIARNRCGKVSGIGRYPPHSERPQSSFSKVTESTKALENLISLLAKKKTTVILTFPKGKCSNGLSGEKVIDIAERWFDISPDSRIHEQVITGKFSTLGGNNKLNKNQRIKRSRVVSEELLLLLKPKKESKGT
jgi:adenine-specific DNA-methyltransferase